MVSGQTSRASGSKVLPCTPCLHVGLRENRSLTSPFSCLCYCSGVRVAGSLFPGEISLACDYIVFSNRDRCGRLTSFPTEGHLPSLSCCFCVTGPPAPGLVRGLTPHPTPPPHPQCCARTFWYDVPHSACDCSPEMAPFLLASGLCSQSKGAELSGAVLMVSGGLQARPFSGNGAPGP